MKPAFVMVLYGAIITQIAGENVYTLTTTCIHLDHGTYNVNTLWTINVVTTFSINCLYTTEEFLQI